MLKRSLNSMMYIFFSHDLGFSEDPGGRFLQFVKNILRLASRESLHDRSQHQRTVSLFASSNYLLFVGLCFVVLQSVRLL